MWPPDRPLPPAPDPRRPLALHPRRPAAPDPRAPRDPFDSAGALLALALQDPADVPRDRAHLLDRLRDARFAQGLRCPRCATLRRPQRWGTAHGRQRYRCPACRRTFSDLTATPAAYSKKLPLWPAYTRCLVHGLSVRAAAARVGVHPSTAFRWRHALLAGLRARDGEQVRGWLELATVSFPYSEKGRRRGWGGVPRGRDRPERRGEVGERAVVVLGCDRAGHVVSGVSHVGRTRRLLGEQLAVVLAERTVGVVVVSATQWCRRAAQGWARGVGSRFQETYGVERRASGLAHVATVWGYRVRLVDWLERFRGVATRYLPNYLVWHRWVDGERRRGLTAAALRWPLVGVPG